MRLASKNELQQQKSMERKLEIDEGIKLAKKVDSLREAHALEQKKLNSFKSVTTTEVIKEINDLISKKDILKAEIKELEEEKSILLIPLDAEWQKVKEKADLIAKKEEELALMKESIKAIEDDLKKKSDEVRIEEARVLDLRSQSESLMEESVLKLGNAEEMLSKCEKTTQEADIHSKSVHADLVKTETNIARRERELEIKEKQLAKKHKELNDRERFINDKYETLLRAQKYGRH